jgi:hypothetical protein
MVGIPVESKRLTLISICLQLNPAERIIVMERRTGKILTGPNAPTAANLRSWLERHPSFEVLRPKKQAPDVGQQERQRECLILCLPRNIICMPLLI